MNKKELHGYEEPDTIMICPEEGYAYDFDGRPYHKLWGGCGWIGPRKECEEEIHGPSLLADYQWIEYLCPSCSRRYKVDNRDKLMAVLEDPSLIPAMNPIFKQPNWTDHVLLSSYPAEFNWGRKFFLDKFKDGDEEYYKKWK
jgi:hypothetical protein